MKLEDQLCTKEQGRKLQKLGVDAECLFCYCWINPGGHNHEDAYYSILPRGFELSIPDSATTWDCDLYTVSELGIMLPNGYDTMRVTGEGSNMWRGYDDNSADFPVDKYFRTEAELRAGMLIACILEGSTTAEEVNKRLNQ